MSGFDPHRGYQAVEESIQKDAAKMLTGASLVAPRVAGRRKRWLYKSVHTTTARARIPDCCLYAKCTHARRDRWSGSRMPFFWNAVARRNPHRQKVDRELAAVIFAVRVPASAH